ncbi:MAG: hypothetical protein AAGK02_04795 [Pseudomonadota bacterium]
MKGRKLFGPASDGGGNELDGAPLGGTRSEAVQRLQVGLSGLFGMVLLVGLASIIQTRAQISEDASVPEAAPTTEPTEASSQRDPLADAGVVPDIPVEPEPTPTQEAAIVPEQGDIEPKRDETLTEDVSDQ